MFVRKPSLTVTGAVLAAEFAVAPEEVVLEEEEEEEEQPAKQESSAGHRGGHDTSHLVPQINFYRLYRNNVGSLYMKWAM